MILKTEKDFITRSKEPGFMSEETRADVSVKLNYLKTYLETLHEYVNAVPNRKHIELIEHGAVSFSKHEFRCMNAQKNEALFKEILSIERHVERLQTIYTA